MATQPRPARNPQPVEHVVSHARSVEFRLSDPAPVPVGNIAAGLNALYETLNNLAEDMRELAVHLGPVLLPDSKGESAQASPQAVRVPLSNIASQLETATDLAALVRSDLRALRDRVDL